MKPSTRSSMVLTLAAALGLSFATVAAAQSDLVRNLYVSAANVPTNVAGVHTYATPREGFNPLTATDEELATYGFPPRPDKQADADHYALWERAMGAAKIRWHGELKPMPASAYGITKMTMGITAPQINGITRRRSAAKRSPVPAPAFRSPSRIIPTTASDGSKKW